MEGWIKIHRKMTEWEWYADINVCRLFLHLLLSANYETKTWHGMTIERGQIIVGRQQLAKETGLSEQQVRTAIHKLKITNNLTIKSTNKFSIITICNYDRYQDCESIDQPTNQPTNQPQNNQQITTTKEIKKKRNKEYINPLYPLFDDADAENAQPTTNDPTPSEERKKVAPKKERFDVEAAIADEPDEIKQMLRRWIDYKKKQHNFSYKSEASFKAFINNLRKLSNDDASLAAAIIDQSIANGWKGIFTLKSVKYGNDWTSNLNAAERAAKCVEMGNAIAARLWNR
jgi:hypothetical protein